jgi:CHAT domain-containing protein
LALLRKYIDVTGNACKQLSPEDPFRVASIVNMEKYTADLLQHLARHWVLNLQDKEYQRSSKIYDWLKSRIPLVLLDWRIILASGDEELRKRVEDSRVPIIDALIPGCVAAISRAKQKGNTGLAQEIEQRLKQVVDILGEPAVRRAEAEAKWLSGQSAWQTGDTTTGARLFRESVELYDVPDLRHYMLRRFREIGDLFHDLGEGEQALIQYEEGLRRYEILRAQTDFPRRTAFAKHAQGLFYRAIASNFHGGKYDQCLLLMELAKGRTTLDVRGLKALDSATGRRMPDPAEISPGLWQKLQSLLVQHDQQYLTGLQAVSGGNDLASRSSEDPGLEARITAAYARLMGQYYASTAVASVLPAHLGSFLSGTTANISSLVSSIPEKAVVVEYFLTDREIFMLLVSRQGIIRAECFPLAEWFHRACGTLIDSVRHNYTTPEGEMFRSHLHKVLVEPLESAMPVGTELIYFVPHATLHYLPFQALLKADHDGSEKPLIWFYDVAYTPSLTMLQFTSSQGMASHAEGGSETGITPALIMGNPDLGNPRMNLSGAEAEAKDLSASVGTSPYLRGDCTRETFARQAPNARLIFVACHAQQNQEYPFLGYLAMSDGPLRVMDMLGLKLDADLLVLNACDTKEDQTAPGDEVIGVTQAALAAGANSVISLMWKVNDQASAQLMTRFLLHYLKGGLSKARALRLAQLELMSSSYTSRSGRKISFSTPYYWAPHTLVGGYK